MRIRAVFLTLWMRKEQKKKTGKEFWTFIEAS
jgi:hypothetical protein